MYILTLSPHLRKLFIAVVLTAIMLSTTMPFETYSPVERAQAADCSDGTCG